MKVVELREKNINELRVIADDLKARIHQRQTELAMNISQNHRSIRKDKKDLARVMTIINEKNRDA